MSNCKPCLQNVLERWRKAVNLKDSNKSILPPIECTNTIKSIRSDENKHQEISIPSRGTIINEEIARSTSNSLYSGLGKIFKQFVGFYSFLLCILQ